MNSFLFVLTPVIELNNLLRYTTLGNLNANDRSMAIISFYVYERYTTDRIIYIHSYRHRMVQPSNHDKS